MAQGHPPPLVLPCTWAGTPTPLWDLSASLASGRMGVGSSGPVELAPADQLPVGHSRAGHGAMSPNPYLPYNLRSLGSSHTVFGSDAQRLPR